MSVFRLLDAENRVASPVWTYVADEATLGWWERWLAVHPSEDTPKVREALATLRNLPQKSFKDISGTYNWYRHNKKQSLSGWTDNVYVAVVPSKFGRDSQVLSNHPITIGEAEKSWTQAKAVKQAIAVLDNFHTTHNIPSNILLGSREAAKAAQTARFVEKGTLRVQEVRLEDDYLHNSCCALFVAYTEPYGQKTKEVQGFIDAQGNVAPLTRARLFDNEEAAVAFLRRAAIQRYFPSFRVVHMNLGITHLGGVVQGKASGHKLPMDSSSSKLQEAVSLLQKRQLQEAIDALSDEELTETLRQRSENTPKRRM